MSDPPARAKRQPVMPLGAVHRDPSSAPGAMIGTLAYVSPEQAREQPITPAADIYAVGVILFELLTRRVPFPGTTALAVLSAHASEQAPSVTERAPDRGISDDLEALVARAANSGRPSPPCAPATLARPTHGSVAQRAATARTRCSSRDPAACRRCTAASTPA